MLNSATSSSIFSLDGKHLGICLAFCSIQARIAKDRTVKLKGTTAPLSPTVCSNLGHLEQIVQGHVWSGLECLWGWRFHSLSRQQPMAVLDHLYLDRISFISTCAYCLLSFNWVALSYNSVDISTAPSCRRTSFGGACRCPCIPKHLHREIAATVMQDFSPQQFPEGSSTFWLNRINNSFDTIDIAQDEQCADGVGAKSITTQEQCESPRVLEHFLCSQRVSGERKTKWASGTGVPVWGRRPSAGHLHPTLGAGGSAECGGAGSVFFSPHPLPEVCRKVKLSLICQERMKWSLRLPKHSETLWEESAT